MLIIGVDPGLSGAIAFYDGQRNDLKVFDMPTLALSRGGKAKREPDMVELARIVDAAGPVANAFVEQVGAMPGQGVSSVFAFGKVYGAALGILSAYFIPLTLVSPMAGSDHDGEALNALRKVNEMLSTAGMSMTDLAERLKARVSAAQFSDSYRPPHRPQRRSVTRSGNYRT